MSDVIYSIGHSTRPADELIAMLRAAGVQTLVDVRRFPASRRHPQYNRAVLERTLGSAGIAYHWLGESLGGRRSRTVPTAESRNNGWEVAAFRYYADAMPTAEFRTGMDKLEALARSAPTAFMCAEKLWWSCHRRLIADLLTVRGWSVIHLLEESRHEPHHLTEFARLSDGQLTYPSLV